MRRQSTPRRREAQPPGPGGPDDIAYSYIRFSSLPQEAGDSIRRQTKGTRDWASRLGVPLDESLQIDRGVSAFRGRNRTVGALGEFLRLAEAGRVRPGSYLVVESLDRLTRQEVVDSATLILNLIAKGIRIVQLQPGEMVYDRESCSGPQGLMNLMLMISELTRGHSESKMKSERVGAAWAEKRRRLRAGEPQKETQRMGAGRMALTGKLPAWLRLRGGLIELIPAHALAVRRAVELVAAGYGYRRAVKRLTDDGIAPPAGGRWTHTYIKRLVGDRRALGEYQPRGRGGVPDGGPVPGYFPAAVSEELLLAAQGAVAPGGAPVAPPCGSGGTSTSSPAWCARR